MQPFDGCVTEISICFHYDRHCRQLILCVARLIHISPSYSTFYRSFEVIHEWELSIDWNSYQMFYANPLLQKNIQSDINYIFKNTQLQRAARAQTDEPE